MTTRARRYLELLWAWETLVSRKETDKAQEVYQALDNAWYELDHDEMQWVRDQREIG